MGSEGTRRQLFAALYDAVRDFADEVRGIAEQTAYVAEPAEPHLDTRPRLRPPGALEEAIFLKLCTGCGDCVGACPHGAIELLGEANDDADTPLMDPSTRPCHLCEDFPCAAACKRGALLMPGSGTWSFGTIRLDPDHCFTFRGPECGACGGLCPAEQSGLVFEKNRPQIAEDQCAGCGLCIDACPTLPVALVFEPTR